MIGLLPEYRYWFNGRPMTREFVGIAALGVSYDITWGERIYQGDAAGAGITFGYALNLSRRLNVEFYGGFGAVILQAKTILQKRQHSRLHRRNGNKPKRPTDYQTIAYQD